MRFKLIPRFLLFAGAVRLSDEWGVVVEKRTRLQHRSNCFYIHERWHQ